MVIVFYDPKEKKLHIATKDEPLKTFDVGDDSILEHVPRDDIAYVQKAHLLTKDQLGQWLQGGMKLEDADPSLQSAPAMPAMMPGYAAMQPGMQPQGTKRYLHPKHAGSAFIPDIITDQYPNGVFMRNKFDFVDLNAIGGEAALQQSRHAQILLKKGSVEIVGDDYIRAHKHKMRRKSPYEAELDRILVPEDMSAKEAASRGGIDHGIGFPEDEAVTINVRV